jgi:3-phosphoshikimate 1-carboxyvinyltransferase
MGATVRRDVMEGRPRVRLDVVERLDPLDITIPGDFSAAAFFLAFALLARIELRIDGVGVNPARTGLLDVLHRMGARIECVDERLDGGEPIADLVVSPGDLASATVGEADVARMIDEIPALAVLAARVPGETRISGARELRVKESDRIAVLVANLRDIGVDADELEDGLVIQGTDAPLAGLARVHDDHRIAMAFGLLSALPDCEVRIDDPAVAAVSDPAFFARLRTIAPPRP